MGLPLTDAEKLKFWKCEMLKKKSKGVPLKKKMSVEKQKWKVLEIAGFGEKSWKKGYKNLTGAAGKKKKSKNIKS